MTILANYRIAGWGMWSLATSDVIESEQNLVVDGLEAYDEDHLAMLAFGDVILQLVKPCVRCQVATTDQASGRVGTEPLRTLAGYRHNPQHGGVTFGMNAIVTAGAGATLTVGSPGRIDWAF